MVLIYSKDVDEFVNQVIDCLDCEFIRIGETDPITIEAIDFCNKKDSFIIKNNYDMELDISTVKSIWFNGGCVFTEGSEYENKCYEVLNDSFLLNMPVKKIGKRISDFETNKLDILLEAKRQGLKIPHTLITGNKVKLNSFFNLHNTKKGIVSKRILDNFLYEDNSFLYNFNLTFPIDFEILNQLPDEFAISLFQEKINADFEIRVICLDGNFYSIAIHNFVDKIDYRTEFRNEENLRFIPFKLPIEIETKLKKVFEKFNLNYGSADFMYSDNEYYFLEINPTGQVSFASSACNYHLEYELAKILENEA